MNKKQLWEIFKAEELEDFSKLLGYGEKEIKKIGVKNGKPVNQINPKTGEIINTYCSCCEAARQLNLNYSKISRVCLGGRKTTGGFSW